MNALRSIAIGAALYAFCVTGYAQTPVQHDTLPTDAAPTTNPTPTGNMAMPTADPSAKSDRMDKQLDAMQAMHDKMQAATTPEQRNALMSDHMKVMQDGMTMMSEMGADGMPGKSGMAAMGGMKNKDAMGADMGRMPEMQDKEPMDSDMAAHREMMEKRMQMMQSMMQMMMDRMTPAPGIS